MSCRQCIDEDSMCRPRRRSDNSNEEGSDEEADSRTVDEFEERVTKLRFQIRDDIRSEIHNAINRTLAMLEMTRRIKIVDIWNTL